MGIYDTNRSDTNEHEIQIRQVSTKKRRREKKLVGKLLFQLIKTRFRLS